MRNIHSNKFGGFLIAAMLAILGGCGGGGGSSSSGGAASAPAAATTTPTVTGTVATGNAIAGAAVTIKDVNGATVTGTTNASGVFSIAVTGLTPPFMLQAVGTTNAGAATTLYSYLPAMNMTSATAKNVNITPITNLVVFELNGKNDPGILYRQPGFTVNGTAPNAANVAAAQTTVRSNLPLATVPSGFDMMYDTFAVAKAGATIPATPASPYDGALDALNITQNGSNVTYTGGTYNSGTGAPTVSAATVTLSLTGTVSSSSSGQVTAIVKNANGAVVPNAIVNFTTNDPVGSFTPSTALTDATGSAVANLKTTNTSGGAATVTASTQVSGTTVTGSMNYSIGAANITLSAITFGSAQPLSAYGTTSVSVTVMNGATVYTTPMTVNFTSACASSGKATLTSSVTTVNGVATANYLDNACNNPTAGDAITATLMSGVSQTANLKINGPTVGSIQYVSAAPTNIAIKGTGGAGRQETSTVTFKVVDTTGKPMSAPVNFALDTALGGMTLTTNSATSDPVTGNVTTTVNAGTVSTPVRVTASIANPALSTQSGQLVVSSGVASQSSFSIAVSTHNIEGWGIDGTTTTITARLADHYGNPVPDGTAVSFITSGGSITPSCTTVGGACTATLTSQNVRPKNGRVPFLAWAVGEESFIDANNNGFADPGGEMLDVNGRSVFIGDPYLDSNENQIHDPNETFVDLNNSATYVAADGLYHGVLCNPNAPAGFCSPQKNIYVSDSPRSAQVVTPAAGNLPALISLPAIPQQVVIFSSSSANITSNTNHIVIPLPYGGVCPNSGGIVGTSGTPASFTVTVVDLNGNAMPAGTTVAFATSSGTITTPASYTVPDTAGCKTGSISSVDGTPSCPAIFASPTFGDYAVSMQAQLATYAPYVPAAGTTPASGPTCTYTGASPGTFTVTVTSPKGTITSLNIPVN